MTPKERVVAALTPQIPDQVPTFELEFQLEEEMFGKKLIQTNRYATDKGLTNKLFYPSL